MEKTYQSAQLGPPTCLVPHAVVVSVERPLVDVGSVLPDWRDGNATVPNMHPNLWRIVPLQQWTRDGSCVGVLAFFFASCSALVVESSFNSWITRLLPAAVSTTREHCARDSFSSQDVISPHCCLILFCNDETQHGQGRSVYQRPPHPTPTHCV